MAENERIRVEIAFRSGQSLTVQVPGATADALEAALAKGEPEALAFEAEDGRYTAVIRMIDALKAFDTIYVITLGGPGTSSETLNILLYQTAFAYYDLGYGSAMVVVFFVLILLVSMLLLRIRQKQAFQ